MHTNQTLTSSRANTTAQTNALASVLGLVVLACVIIPIALVLGLYVLIAVGFLVLSLVTAKVAQRPLPAHRAVDAPSPTAPAALTEGPVQVLAPQNTNITGRDLSAKLETEKSTPKVVKKPTNK